MTDDRQSRREQAITNICRKLLGETPTKIEFPGGRSRRTAIAYCGEAIYAVSRRGSVQRAVLEAAVLKQLFELGVPVPRLIASQDHWTIQEYLGDIRLSQGLDKAGPTERLKLMTLAIQGLAQIQDAGRQAGLRTKVAAIGRRKEWLEKFIAAPQHVSALIAVPPPDLNASALLELLSVPTSAFIKWDARPGNAVIREGGAVAWFDWEHCGCRSPLDDLAWLLGDEWAPEDESLEAELLETFLPEFSVGRCAKQGRDYLMAFGTLHMCIRLSLILSHKGDGDWWDRDYCLASDKIGVTAQEAGLLCRRAARWSQTNPLTRPLSSWFESLNTKIEAL